MLETLLKVPAGALADARLELALPWPVLAVLGAGAVVAALALGGYLPAPRRLGALPWLRGALAVLAVFALARPEAVVRAPESGAAPVAVLVDHSLSMGIADAGAATRAGRAGSLFRPGEGPLARELEARFPVRYQGFGAGLEPAGDAPAPGPSAVSDPLGAALQAVSATRLSGLVLVSDGGQVSTRAVDQALLRLRAAGVPVHVVAVGSPGLRRDLAVAAVSVPDTALPGDDLDLEVWLTASGLDGEEVPVSVRDGGVLVAEGVARIAGGRSSTRLRVRLDEPGQRVLEVAAHPPGGDDLVGDDAVRRLVRVRGEPARVLHFEGEPRFEVKFVRRAVTGDTAIALSSLVRTGDNRFLRLGVADPHELGEGFPADAGALFRYQVLVLGSVEAAAFGPARLALLEAFVARRGGSVLFLGGRNALAEGGFRDTPVAALLPVRLGAPQPGFRTAAAALLTREGRVHPVTRDLPALAGAGRALPLPPLAVVNPVRAVKPGASVLLEGDDGRLPSLALLAWHRYGAGRVAVMPARDTWRWRMHADVPLDDHTHQVFWRRLLRWLAREVPGRVEVTTAPAVAAPGQTVEVRARVRDAAWRPRADATPVALITTPLGEIQERAMTWIPGEDGRYVARFTAADTGVHEVTVRVAGDDGEPVTGAGGLLVDAAGEEFRHPGLDEALLRRIAEATGGSYRRADDAAGLAARVAASAPLAESWRRVPLWNAPALVLAMLALALAEWWLRRRRRELP